MSTNYGVKILCPTGETMQLKDMNPLQGALKHRTQGDVDSLRTSLITNGLLQPFVIWNNYLLDGHGRYTALSQMAQADLELAETQWPVIKIEASDIEAARQLLLEMNVKYGKITPRGLELFLRETPAVKVPTSLNIKVPKTLPGAPLPAVQHKERTHILVKLRIRKDMVQAFTDVIKNLGYVEIA